MKPGIDRWIGWQLQRAQRVIGWPGTVGVACGFVAAVANLVLVDQFSRSVDQQASELALLKAEIEASRRRAGPLSAAELAVRFHDDLPPSTSTSRMDAVERIEAAAAAEGLMLEHGRYVLKPASEDALENLRIELPVRGAYPALRRFLDRVLRDTPALALEGIRLRRSTIAEAVVEADMLFVLYLRAR
jgi:hypothetical protein